MKYDFKDLMSFGPFILALLTFIFYNCKQRFSIKPWKQAWNNRSYNGAIVPFKLSLNNLTFGIEDKRSSNC